jgi:glycosyltransferase involved in cell wall biosynthesis
MASPTVAVAMHDGFFSCGTGAGRGNRVFLRLLTELLPAGVRLVVLPVQLDTSSPEFDPAWHADTLRLLEHVEHLILPVDNGTNGQVRFGGLGCFRQLVTHTARTLIRAVLPDSRPLLVVAFDAPFLGLPTLLPAETLPNLVLVPRSTALIHDPTNQQRMTWERDGMHTVASAGGRIAAISHYMREHLATAYRLPDAALTDLPNGLAPADWDTARAATTYPLPAPAHHGFLLAMGRATPYKGFDDLLDALELLRGTGPAPPHLLLAAVTESPRLSPYQRDLAHRITRTGLSATLITRFDRGVTGLLGDPALRAVIVPSRAEPFGRVPLEAYAAGAAPVIATTAGGLAEQIIPGRTGITAPPQDPAALAHAIREGLNLTPAQRAAMRQAAGALAASRFDYHQAVQRFLAHTAPWLAVAPPTARRGAPI